MNAPRRNPTISDSDIEEARRRIPLVDLVGAAVPMKKGSGGHWGRCPFHNEETPSFKVDQGGNFYECFGCGEKGDAITFVQKTQGLNFPDAVRQLLGMEPGLAPVTRAAPEPQENPDNPNIKFAREIWEASQPAENTDAERYLRGRGITIPLPPTLRFHPSMKHKQTGLMFPALVAAIQGPGGDITGVLRTYLLAGGAGKAKVNKPKMALGRISGGAIRLSAMTERLALCEGIEDGLSILQGRPGLTCWAAIGTSSMPGVKVPDSVVEITLCPDGDEAGETAAHQTSTALARNGRLVKIARPPVGMDWNDLLNKPDNVVFPDWPRETRHVG